MIKYYLFQMAREMNLRRSFSIGLLQIQTAIRLGMIFGMVKTSSGEEEMEINHLSYHLINSPFAPTNDDMKFVDEDESTKVFINQEREKFK